MAHQEQHHLNVGIARVFNAYGPGDSLRSRHVVPDFILQALELKTGSKTTFKMIGDGTQTRSFAHATDITQGLVKLAESKDQGIFNLGSEEEVRIIDLAHMILTKTNVIQSKINFLHVPVSPKDIRRRAADISRARTVLGWEPKIDFNQGLPTTIEYYERMRSQVEPQGAYQPEASESPIDD